MECSCGYSLEAATSEALADAFQRHRRLAEAQPMPQETGAKWRRVPACRKAVEQEPLPIERRNRWDGAPEDEWTEELARARAGRRVGWRAQPV